MKILRMVLLAVAGGLCFIGSARAQDVGPDRAFEALVHGIGEGKLDSVWQLLPASYQKDIAAVVSELAGKIDGEIWNQSSTVFRKLIKVLKEKKDFLLANPALGQLGVEKDALAKGWTPICEMLETIAASDLLDADKLKNPDIEKFLKETGSKLLKQILAISEVVKDPSLKQDIESMKGAKAQLVKSEGDTATLKVSGMPTPKEETAVVRVDGKWIPKDMADHWGKGIAELKQKVGEIKSDDIAKAKPALLAGMKKIEESLDKLAAATSQTDFEAELGNLMTAVMSLGAAG